MSEDANGKFILTAGTVVIVALVLLAATFGMGEWKHTPPETAQAPTGSTNTVR